MWTPKPSGIFKGGRNSDRFGRRNRHGGPCDVKLDQGGNVRFKMPDDATIQQGSVWEVWQKNTAEWRCARVMNVTMWKVELKYEDAPELHDVAKTFTTTPQKMKDVTRFRLVCLV
jgi:hypothetical protein